MREHSTQYDSLCRAISAMGKFQYAVDAADDVKAQHPFDRDAATIVKTGTLPASTSTVTQLGFTSIAALTDILGPSTASGALFSRALQLRFADYNSIWAPGIAASGSYFAFVAQGSPLSVQEYDLSAGVTLSPQKAGFISTMSRELVEGTNAETEARLEGSSDGAIVRPPQVDQASDKKLTRRGAGREQKVAQRGPGNLDTLLGRIPRDQGVMLSLHYAE